MLRLRTAYVIILSILSVLFHVLYMGHRIPFSSVNLLLLFLAAAGNIYSNLISYILIFLSWTFFFPLFLMVYKADPVNAAIPLIIFNGMLAGMISFKYMMERDAHEWEIKLKEKEQNSLKLSDEYRELADAEKGIKAKELSIVNLYEITKTMSAYLKFDEIFKAFSSFLKENFAFRGCDLLILDREGSVSRLAFIYSIWDEGIEGAFKQEFDHDKLIKVILDDPKALYLSREEDESAFDAIGINDEWVEVFVAIPLLSEKNVVGILTIENLPKSDLEKLVILSMQFALEIKKVLLYEMVEKLAITDSLTSLYVRRYFMERLDEEFQRSKRYGLKFSFLMIDIDNFKACNDAYGHLVGDVILKGISDIMKESVREIDLISRYGGEEFALVLPETGIEGAKLVAERLRTKIKETLFKAYDESVKITVSIGISVYPEDSGEIKGVVERADAAMYIAKKSGKDIVCEWKS